MNNKDFNRMMADASVEIDQAPEIIARANVDEVNAFLTRLKTLLYNLQQADTSMGDAFAQARAEAKTYKDLYNGLLNKLLDRVRGDY